MKCTSQVQESSSTGDYVLIFIIACKTEQGKRLHQAIKHAPLQMRY